MTTQRPPHRATQHTEHHRNRRTARAIRAIAHALATATRVTLSRFTRPTATHTLAKHTHQLPIALTLHPTERDHTAPPRNPERDDTRPTTHRSLPHLIASRATWLHRLQDCITTIDTTELDTDVNDQARADTVICLQVIAELNNALTSLGQPACNAVAIIRIT